MKGVWALVLVMLEVQAEAEPGLVVGEASRRLSSLPKHGRVLGTSQPYGQNSLSGNGVRIM